jgi:hypothetical protein
MDQVLSRALTRQPTPIEWNEADQPPVTVAEEAEVVDGVGGLVTH